MPRNQFRDLVGALGALILAGAGVRLLLIHGDFEDVVHALGIMCIGLASIPLLLIQK